MSTSDGARTRAKRAPRKPTLGERALTWVYGHPVAAGVCCALLVVVTCACIFYLQVFSGISASADFVYNSF